MKHLFVVFLMGIAVFFFGCSDNPSAPENVQGDQVTTSLYKVTGFSSRSDLVAPIQAPTITPLPGGRTLAEGNKTQWLDQATDPRVSGDAFWTTNSNVNKFGAGKTWGTCELFVDNAEASGKWEITWNGRVEGSPATGDLYIKGVAKGVGVEGDVEGLTAKWFYTLDLANVGFFYTSEGFIQEQ